MIKLIAHKGGKSPAENNFFKVECQYGNRKFFERYNKVENAQAFVKHVLGKDKFRWKDENTIAAKGADALLVISERLEEIMEAKGKGSVDSTTVAKIHKFFHEEWAEYASPKPESDHQATKAVRKAAPSGDVITLDVICKKNKWNPKQVRQALRKSGEKKEGRWAWAKNEVAAVEERIRRILS